MPDFARDGVLLRFDGVVVEVFLREYDKSLRVPASWIGVEIKPEKHDRTTLRVGTVNAGAPAMYGPGISVMGNYWPIEIDNADEPAYRDFFAQVATAAGRPLSA
jgi:hypothetical protein